VSLRNIANALGIPENGWISVFAYYGDDSGSSPNQEVFMVSGYLARAATWFHDVEVPWSRVLANAPSIRYFKSRQCEYLEGEFDGWLRTDADEKRNALIDVVVKLAAKGEIREYSSTIRWDDYNSSVTGGLRAAYPNPYFFCVHGIVSLIAKAYIKESGEPPHDRVAYVFDEQGVIETQMAEQYHHVRQTVDSLIAGTMGYFGFDDDKLCPPLQVADLIAYHARRDFLQPAIDKGQQRPEVKALRENTRGEIAIWNPDKLRAFVIEIETGSRQPNFWR